MADYILHRDEAVILKEDSVYHPAKGLNPGRFELVLTTKKLVLIKITGLGLRRSVTPKEVRIFPLSQIRLFNGQAQVALVNRTQVEIYFLNGPETFRFYLNKVAANWVEQINLLATGRESEVVLNNNAINASSPEFVKEIQKEAWDALLWRPGAKPRAPEPVVKVAGECAHCGAPIEGFRGRLATCVYCGRSQQLDQPTNVPVPGRAPAAAPAPEAGWKPDPKRAHHYRWWDGRAWTGHVSDYGHPSHDPL